MYFFFLLRQKLVKRFMTWDVWIISKFSSSKVKNTNYRFLLIFKNFITLFRRFCLSRSRAYFEVFSIKDQKNFCWEKIFCRTTFFLDKGILRSRQSETFKKGHKINIGAFYTKKQTFSQSMFYTKSFKILS